MGIEDFGSKLDRLLEQQRTLLDRQQIFDCICAYARGLDRLDEDLIASAYHPDAIDDHGMIIAGPTELAAWAVDLHGKATTATQHHVSTHSCELDGDTAHVETYYHSVAQTPNGNTNLASGRWLDRFERRNGVWKIAVRICIPEWSGTLVLHSPPEVAHKLHAMSLQSTRDRLDPSYARPLNVDPDRVRAKV